MLRSFGRAAAPLFVFSSVAFLFSCSSSSSGPPNGGGSAPKPSNATWCPGAAAAPGCGAAAIDVCGVCIRTTPSGQLTRTTDTKEYAGSGAPDTSCDDPAHTKPLGTPKNVSFQAWVKIFANGPDSKNVKIEVFKEQLAGGVQTGRLGDSVASTTSTDKLADGTGTKPETITKGGTTTTRVLYAYSMDNVPTETPLIVKTSSKTSVAVDGWFDLYDFNIVVHNDDPTCASDTSQNCWNKNGSYRYYPRALGNDDYATIIRAAYSRAPSGGKGAVAGEVHDCGDVRLSNAAVGIGPTQGLGIAYLWGEEDNPLPDSSKSFTGPLGLYAYGELDPGMFTVAAAGKDSSNKLVALGDYTVQTFPDSVSVFTFRGLRAWQVAK